MNNKSVTLRTVQKEMTRQRLIDAARDAYASQGYLETTVDNITEAAGATRATFYLHFQSKAQVALEVWDAYIDEPTRQLWSDLPPLVGRLPDEPRVLREEWFPRVLEHWEQRGALIRALWNVGIVEAEVGERLHATRQHVAGLLVSSLKGRTGRSPAALQIRAVAAFDVQTQLFLDWLDEHIPHETDEIMDALSDVWLALLR